MKPTLKVLIVEDHPFVIEGYTNVLNQMSMDQHFDLTVDSAHNCDSAMSLIENAMKSTFYDLVFLDIRIPPSQHGKILCGEDIGISIRNLNDSTKIIVSTHYRDTFRLNNILKNVDPDGFMVKVDVNFEVIANAIATVLTDPPFYSHSIIKLLRQQMTNELILDQIDRQLLYHISIGTKTKDLPNFMPLSMAGIERRKRRLKRELNATGNDDFNLVQVAKEKGFI